MESAKECVTTHLPNQPALKMDGAGASGLYRAVRASLCKEVLTSRRVAVVSVEGAGVRPTGAATGADLGGSSNYSSENLED